MLVTARPQWSECAHLLRRQRGGCLLQPCPALQQPFFLTTPSLLMHYRGYGAVQANLRSRALRRRPALFDQIRTEHPNIVVVGRSLGSGVAVHLGWFQARRPPGPLSPFRQHPRTSRTPVSVLTCALAAAGQVRTWKYAARVDTRHSSSQPNMMKSFHAPARSRYSPVFVTELRY